jgi:hypothetical protein
MICANIIRPYEKFPSALETAGYTEPPAQRAWTHLVWRYHILFHLLALSNSSICRSSKSCFGCDDLLERMQRRWPKYNAEHEVCFAEVFLAVGPILPSRYFNWISSKLLRFLGKILDSTSQPLAISTSVIRTLLHSEWASLMQMRKGIVHDAILPALVRLEQGH